MKLHKLLALTVLLGIACAEEPTRPPDDTIVERHPAEQAILNLIGTYEQKRAIEYGNMFTGDFVFEFSNETDPDLVAKYATGWFKADEMEASAHLFQGFTPPGGYPQPAASRIDINLASTLPVDDPISSDPLTHKVLFALVDGVIVIPPGQGQSEATTFIMDHNVNVIYLVRGDEAVGLNSVQPADSLHWYVYRWADLTQAPTRFSPRATSPATWGKVRALYR